jgi:hypothetical protein
MNNRADSLILDSEPQKMLRKHKIVSESYAWPYVTLK